MEDEVKVTVLRYPDRENLVLAYTCPLSGKRKTKSAGTANEGDAWKEAAKWEEELRAGLFCAPGRVLFDDFLTRYDEEKLSTLAPTSRGTALASLRHLKRVLGIDRLAKLTAGVLSQFQAKLRAEGMRDTTIAHHLRHVKAATRWAERMGLLTKAPTIEMPKRAGKGQSFAKSRGVTTEEYERMLLAVPKVRKGDAADWQRFLQGLWLSGLRLGEGVALSWEEHAALSVDTTGKYPVLRIRAEGQKSGRDEILPLTPDFGAWLLAVPEAERHGRVFRLPGNRREIGRIVGDFGRKAGVKVGTTTKRDKESRQLVERAIFAGAHSLRRGFASRWARRVSPSVLKRLMRHASIATTEGYYVHLQAGDVAAELWGKWGTEAGQSNISGNIVAESADSQDRENDVTPCAASSRGGDRTRTSR